MQRIRNYSIELTLISALLLAVAYFAYLGYGLVMADSNSQHFSGLRAMDFVAQQIEFGPRITGSEVGEEYEEWLVQELTTKGWDVVIQPFLTSGEVRAKNFVAISPLDVNNAPVVLIGAHYDTRAVADRDSNVANRDRAPIGANSGASGPAVLLELVRSVNIQDLNVRICFAFIDASDNEGLLEWGTTEGSAYLAENLNNDIDRCANPQMVLTLDMVGSTAEYTVEQRSTASIIQALQRFAVEAEAAPLFVDQAGPVYNADHIPFLNSGIPAAHISDALYPFRHSTEDTLDKLDAEYFKRLGQTLELWLEAGAPIQ